MPRSRDTIARRTGTSTFHVDLERHGDPRDVVNRLLGKEYHREDCGNSDSPITRYSIPGDDMKIQLHVHKGKLEVDVYRGDHFENLTTKRISEALERAVVGELSQSYIMF